MFHTLVSRARSYRRFDETEPVPTQVLLKLMDYARLSPSAANLQTLRFFLINRPEDCARLFPLLKWAGYLRYWDGPEPGERPTAYILVLNPLHASKYHQLDIGIAAQSIALGATDLGYGACMLASVDKESAHKELTLPRDYEIGLVIALGKPNETVVVENVIDPEDIEYWRDEEGVHHVPKRPLSDLILNYELLQP